MVQSLFIDGKQAKPYQVKQVKAALEKLNSLTEEQNEKV
jgi:hypothetical protein